MKYIVLIEEVIGKTIMKCYGNVKGKRG